jgi:hypothetical protein
MTDSPITYERIQEFLKKLPVAIPLTRAKIWPGDDRSVSWAVECQNIEEFLALVERLAPKIQFLAYDESSLDEDTLQNLQDDLFRISEEGNYSFELANKAISALRSHEGELFSIQCFAFAEHGPALCCRVQTQLARFIFNPERLLNSDSLAHVRKLKTLHEG